jgi:hypothetical protein
MPLYVSTLAPESAEFAGAFGYGMITFGGEEPALNSSFLFANPPG